QQAGAPAKKGGRERDTGARIDSVTHSEDTSRAADHKLPTSALRYVIGSRPPTTQRTGPTSTPPPITTRAQIPITIAAIRAPTGRTEPTRPRLTPSTRTPRPIDHPNRKKRSPQTLDFLTEKVLGAVMSGRSGWFPGWRRADSLTFCR